MTQPAAPRPRPSTTGHTEIDTSFGCWSDEQLLIVATLGNEERFEPGSNLTETDVPSRQGLVIMAGHVSFVAADGTVAGTVGPGHLVTPLGPRTTQCRLRADDHVTARVLGPRSLARLLDLPGSKSLLASPDQPNEEN